MSKVKVKHGNWGFCLVSRSSLGQDHQGQGNRSRSPMSRSISEKKSNIKDITVKVMGQGYEGQGQNCRRFDTRAFSFLHQMVPMTL